MSWDLCDAATLVEIAECLGGEALAKICTLFCEDYNGRSSGVPDLILWNPETKACKFVEVKGPGDTERENQKLWMDSLINAGVDVEVCRVYEPNKRPAPKSKGKGKRTPKSVPPKKGRGKHASTPSNLEATTMDDGVSPAVHDLVNDDVGWDDDDDDDQLPVPGTKTTQAMVNPSLKRPFDGSETVTPSNRKKRKVSFP
ncbi:hypothetical protein ONZ45_g19130 [Pleurotus djamor]|nr:hypothetical protein ONZ45_g19130 [Pleurotus djamor]